MRRLTMPTVWPAYGGIVLRPFRAADSGMLRDLATDPYVPLIGSLPAFASDAEALAFIDRQHERVTTGAGYSFCVADDAGAALGTAGLWVAAAAAAAAETATVGYTVAPAARGRGVAARALRALVAFGWTLPELERIEAYVEPWNAASIRTAEAAGFRLEQRHRDHQEIGGRRVDMLRFALTRSSGVTVPARPEGAAPPR